MENRNRNTAYMLMGAGLFLLLGNMIGFFTVTALLVVWLGIYKIRSGENKMGYILFGIGILMLLDNHFVMVTAIVLISLGYFFYKSKQVDKDESFVQKHNLLESIKYNKDQWVLRNTSIWSLIGEIHLDLTLAMMEEKEVTIILQGMIGDVDIIVPEDMGISVDSTTFVGQSVINKEKEAGLLNKVLWRSPHFEESEYKVRFVISYMVGDIKIKLL